MAGPELDSLWVDLVPAPHLESPLVGRLETDVLVVGGGFLGLSTALHLAESGHRVALIEAKFCGYGASGRNSGFVVPDLKASIGPDEVAAHLGAEHAERLLSLVAGSGRAVFELIARHGIDCAPEPIGWTQPATTEAMLRVLEKRVATWLRAGADVSLMDKDETRRNTGLSGYLGAMHVASGGQLNPFAYARGLAAACKRAGVLIYENSPATAMTRLATGHEVTTPTGSVAARKVLLATNAMVGDLSRTMADTLIPTRIFQIATQVLPAELRQQILPSGSPVSDTRNHTFALRWTPDGRLVTGGMVLPGPGRRERAGRSFARRLGELTGTGTEFRAEYVWSGVIAITLEWLPRLTRLGDGLYGAIGCNGRGIAMTTVLGREIAAYLGGATPEDRFVLPIRGPKPAPGRRLAEIGPHLFLPLSSFKDRRDQRRARGKL